ncbi:Protein of unknown function [Streptomyces sp. KS_16]|nr:uncharacterized protein DUF3631 [Streptomyces sp. 2321.6]SDR32882.1 Protein of unknown function [Streptomyces sp. KS_16]SED25912.1 Protein of unknown function [Streptomyces sp. 2133.1]SNC70363.1 Protein of unknown function [Streptomyces sp. 2114.4]
MQPTTPDAHSQTETGKAKWPAVAIPGKPGAHLAGEQAGEGGEPRSGDGAAQRPSVPEPRTASAGVLIGPLREGEQVLAELRAQIARYVVMPSEEALTAVTLWVAATHLQRAWQHAPRLAIVAPEKRCGKSRLLDVITETVHNPLITVNASPAAIFRSVDDDDPITLLVDEADTLFGTTKAAEKNEEVRGLINAGHQRNRPTLRVVGPEHKPTKFSTFAMAALAGIGDLPDTVMDRSVVIRMRRRAGKEKVAHFRTVRDTPALHAIRDRLAAWLKPLFRQAMDMEPAMPVEDRAADTWEPLVTIADLAGGEWPALARTACRVMTDYEAGQDEQGGLRTRLLVGIRRAFAAENDPPAMRTKRLLEHLNADKEAPWADYGPDGLTPRGLQERLKPYGLHSSNRRFPDGTQARGFTRNQFLDTWARYCPEPTPSAGPAQQAAEPLPDTGA